MHVLTLCDWFSSLNIPLLLATPTTQLSLESKRWSR